MNYRNSFKKYLGDLAKPQPPGGGSCGALSFCLGASLLEMAAGFSLKKGASSGLKRYLSFLRQAKKRVYPLIDQDAQVFSKFLKAKDAKKRRKYLSDSAKICLVLGETCYKIFSRTKGIELAINKAIISDFYLGLDLVGVALSSALVNLKENNKSLKDKKITTKIRSLQRVKKYSR